MCRWFDSAPGHHFSKPTVLSWLCRFWTFPAPRGVAGGFACATPSMACRKSGEFHPVSIPFCSLLSKNSGEPCRSGTRRMPLKTTGYTCVEKGGLTGELLQQRGISTCDRAIFITALGDTRPAKACGPDTAIELNQVTRFFDLPAPMQSLHGWFGGRQCGDHFDNCGARVRPALEVRCAALVDAKEANATSMSRHRSALERNALRRAPIKRRSCIPGRGGDNRLQN